VVGRLRRLVEAPDASRPLEPVQLAAAARSVVELLAPEARRRGIDVAIAGDAPPVLADPVALEQIVHNLVGNAMHALDAVPRNERRLTLGIAADSGQGVLTVRDSGPGIAPENLARLFEPFYTTKREGLGLGLSLCESLAQAMQGTLTARNAASRGAEFRLALLLASARP
jgi:C4-dicarboxylate-specific signal transduction histidine kinase